MPSLVGTRLASMAEQIRRHQQSTPTTPAALATIQRPLRTLPTSKQKRWATMDGETFHMDPNGAVILGARSILSLIGLSTALAGYWYMEHQFDNDGAAALMEPETTKPGSYVEMEEKPKEEEAEPVAVLVSQKFHPDGVRELVRVSTQDSKSDTSYNHMEDEAVLDPEAIYPTDERAAPEQQPKPLSLEAQQRLNDAMPLPRVMLVGFGIWTISFLFDPSIGGVRLYWNFWNVTSVILAAFVGPIIAIPIRVNTLNRDLERKKKAITSLVVVSVTLCATATADFFVDAPWFFNVFGVLFMLLSYHILRRSRKMGLTWDLEAKASDDVMVQNLGTMLLFFGIVLFWIGTNGVLRADLQQSYLPLFINARSWCVFVAGLLFIVPSMLVMDLAFDQGSSVVTYHNYLSWLDGSTMAQFSQEIKLLDMGPFLRLLETPFFYFCGWSLMGLCSFLPFGATALSIQKFCTFSVCLVIGPVYSFLVLPAFWRADAAACQNYTYIYYVLMILLATGIGVGGGVELILSMSGVAMILVGQRRDLYERKRGQTWLERQNVNTNPQVYGLGLPLFVLGWVFLCLAMSVPM